MLIANYSHKINLRVYEILLRRKRIICKISHDCSGRFQVLRRGCRDGLFFGDISLSSAAGVRGVVFGRFLAGSILLSNCMGGTTMTCSSVVAGLRVSGLETVCGIGMFSPVLLAGCTVHGVLLRRVRKDVVRVSSVDIRAKCGKLSVCTSDGKTLRTFSGSATER